MSSSAMYFRENMFDLVISNAVLEHLKKPHETLKEIYRVLRPGGHAYMSWNPFSGLAMGGHDIGMPFHYPWAHLRLDDDRLVKELGRVFSSEEQDCL